MYYHLCMQFRAVGTCRFSPPRTSSFSGIGKSKWLKILQSDNRFIDALSLLGEEEVLASVAVEVLEEYVCYIWFKK